MLDGLTTGIVFIDYHTELYPP